MIEDSTLRSRNLHIMLTDSEADMLRRMARIEDGVSQADFIRIMIRQEYKFRFLNNKTGQRKHVVQRDYKSRRNKTDGKEE